MRLKATARNRPPGGLSDALAAALIEGPFTPPPTPCSQREIDAAGWDLYCTDEDVLWARFGDEAIRRAAEWGWVRQHGDERDGAPLHFWAEHFYVFWQKYRT